MKRLRRMNKKASNDGIKILHFFNNDDMEFEIEFTMDDIDDVFEIDQEELDIRDVHQYFREISSLINVNLYDYNFDESESRIVVLKHENPSSIHMTLVVEEED